MLTMKNIFYSSLFLLILSSCNSNTNKENTPRSEEDLLQMIHAWSNTDSLADSSIRAQYTEVLNEFLTHYPQNPEHENLLFLGAKNDMDRRQFEQAAEKYARFSQLYPQSRSHADALFGAGFLYHNEVHQLDSAKKYFEIFLITYPDHMLAEAALHELTYLGKSPEEMLEGLKKGL